MTPATVDLGPARQRLDDVYARPPLNHLDAPHQESLLGRWARHLADLFPRAPGAGRWLFLVLGALLLALVVWLVLRSLRGISAGREARVADGASEVGSDPDAEWAAALDAARRGDHREAVRRGFRSALLAVARGRMAVDPAWTTRELLAHTRADTDLLAALAPAAATFDVAWYSRRPVTAADWAQQRRRCEAVRALAGIRSARIQRARA